VHPLTGGGNGDNLVSYLHALDHLSEDRVAEELRLGSLMIQTGIVVDVDEKLARGTVNIGGPGHGKGSSAVFQAVGGLVGKFRTGGLPLLHSRFHAATLDHKAGDHPMEDKSVIKTLADVGPEVFGGKRRLLVEQLDFDGAEAGFHHHPRSGSGDLLSQGLNGAGEDNGQEQ